MPPPAERIIHTRLTDDTAVCIRTIMPGDGTRMRDGPFWRQHCALVRDIPPFAAQPESGRSAISGVVASSVI